MSKQSIRHSFRKAVVYGVAASFIATSSQPSFAGLTELSPAPFANATSTQVKPNIMFLMDTSGSMLWSHMPDDEENYITKVGYKSWQCNSLYYNPRVAYVPPKTHDGFDYPAASFNSAFYDGFINTARRVDLTTSFQAYDLDTLQFQGGVDLAQPAYYYLYAGPQTQTSNSLRLAFNSAPCAQDIGTSPFAATASPPPAAATASAAPPTPSVVATNLGTTTGSLFTAANAGNYKYQVTAINSFGESAPSALTPPVTVSAGDGISLAITEAPTPPTGTQPATGYRIYRTTAGGSTTGFSVAVPRASSGGVFQASTAAVDLMADTTGTWTKVLVSSNSSPTGADERQNFANWYSYYRTRITMTKSAATRAFVQLNNNYRLGFITINPGNPVRPNYYLPIADLDGTQKPAWFSKMTGQIPIGSTPNREALARVGRHYAGKFDGINTDMTPDPVQYSCQQNFTIMTTDGFWNTGDETVGPVGLNGTTRVGNLDGDLSVTPRPLWDGAADTKRDVVAKTNAYAYVACSQPQKRTVQYQKRTVQNQRRSVQYRKRILQNQRRTIQNQQRTIQLQRSTVQNQRRIETMQTRTRANIFAPFGPWTNTPTFSCVPVPFLKECRTLDTGFANIGPCTPSAPGVNPQVTCNLPPPAWVNVGSCAASNPAFGPTVSCRTSFDSNWVNVGTCTVSSPPGGPNVTCQVASDTNWVNIGTCNPSNPGAGPTVSCRVGSDTGYQNSNSACVNSSPPLGPIVDCQQTADTGWVNINTCVPSNPASGPTVTCQVALDTGVVNSGTCTPSSPPAGPIVTCPPAASDTGWVNIPNSPACAASDPINGPTVTCQSPAGQKVTYQTTTNTTTTLFSAGVQTGDPVQSQTVGAAADLTGACYLSSPPALGSYPVIPDASINQGPPPGCGAWPCTFNTTITDGGSTDSLSDVAYFYYNNDLRPDMEDNVHKASSSSTSPEDDTAAWQHMTTFTMALGVPGTLNYQSDYKTATIGDFADIRAGKKNWPLPVTNQPTAIDDTWHAAVNGRGEYFSAGDPETVVDGLTRALAAIRATPGSASAAATSNLEPVAGDNFAYTAKYVTLKWSGELEAHRIDLTTGQVQTDADWSAAGQLDQKAKNACDNRSIFLFRGGAADNLVPFTWNTRACDASGAPTGPVADDLSPGEKAYFSATQAAQLSQYSSMTDGSGITVDQRGAAPGANLVNFLRGQRGREGFVTNSLNSLYRARDHILGDIVNAQPVYVKAPFATYADAGYLGPTGYRAAKSSRPQTVYVAANDGMLHAFDAVLGTETWAFIPTIVLPELYKLADNSYANNHMYTVDGTPSVGDAFDPTPGPTGGWKTVLVAGLNGGGKGYYALDITDPLAPKALWEFKWSDTCYDPTDPTTRFADCHIGYTFNNPIVSKLTGGANRWVVFVTSGYNNVNSPLKAGDGLGYLYTLDAFTGEILSKIPTSAGDAATPSGLNYINNWVDNTLIDNTTLRVYGVDTLGNIWRFDVNDVIAPAGREATLIGTAKDSTGTAQPITTRPELATVGGSPYVFVATGRLLHTDDITNLQDNSIYGIKDPMNDSTYADLRGSLKKLTMTTVGSGATATRTIDCTGLDANCDSADGWVTDLPDNGERVNVDMKLQVGTLVVASNVPQNTACNIGGYSWLNYLNFATGLAVANSPNAAVAQKLSDSLAVGLNIVRLPDGKTVVITTTSDAKQTTVNAPFDIPNPAGKRISWREISQ